MKKHFWILIPFLLQLLQAQDKANTANEFTINQQEYLEMRGANVMLAHDFYPESHQGGVGIIQNGIRVATNGDLRLEPAPGQWQPVPKVGKRQVDRETQRISVRMEYPDESKNRKGFNPIEYPDLELSYTLSVTPQGKSFKIIVDLDEPLPEEWVGQVGMNLEFFPGYLFGKSYYMDQAFGIFNRQANGPGKVDDAGNYVLEPMAQGKKLVIVPEDPKQTLSIENLGKNRLRLLDGRAQHSNGWFIVRSLVPSGATKNAIEWLVTPNTIKDFLYSPVVQVSQVGYHTKQEKIAIIETDKLDKDIHEVQLLRLNEHGGFTQVLSQKPKNWGPFLRYEYYQFDFSHISTPGLYQLQYGDYRTHPFQISETVFERNVWQPTLEYFLPVQMCHMRVNDRYKVWHGLSHMDDARMAPINTNHFDGYLQGPETLTKYKSGEHVPGLNIGGWYDAGDYDLRIESQAATVKGLSEIYELFQVDYDNTSIDQKTRIVEMLTPDGTPDILQQIEHGILSIVGGYKSMGRFYRGIIVPTLRQYILLGDPANHTDNEIYEPKTDTREIPVGREGSPDDRWVFTEDNPKREAQTAAALATASRVLQGYNDQLAMNCLDISQAVWKSVKVEDPIQKVALATALLKTTGQKEYSEYLLEHQDAIVAQIGDTGWIVGPVLPLIGDKGFTSKIQMAAKAYRQIIQELGQRTPYGIPYEPNIWGAGWGIQSFGVKQYYWHRSFPEIFPKTYMLNALNFILGTHPGVNTASFASGVGSRSLTQAYGINRGDFSFIPGGIGSGTALIRPDFPELLEWPFLWQQTEYVLGGGTTDYLFLVLAADRLLGKE
ncbi:MAG: glycoside hydrolase family 9 protein [Bacteroidota bacterium]